VNALGMRFAMVDLQKLTGLAADLIVGNLRFGFLLDMLSLHKSSLQITLHDLLLLPLGVSALHLADSPIVVCSFGRVWLQCPPY
jgi:hypothetical protein